MKAKVNDFDYNEQVIKSYIEKAIVQKADMILFPEMALCGYSFERREENHLQQMALIKKIKSWITSGLTVLIGGLEKENETYYLSQFIIGKTIQTYRKIHIGQREAKYVSPGESITVYNAHDFSFGLMMCYDTHFPELSTQMALAGAKIIFAPSAVPNNPVKRLKTWKKYLTARAYDNRVYVIANNLVFDEKGGGIIAIDPYGDVVLENDTSDEGIHFVTLKEYTFTASGMKNRDFKAHRKAQVYKNAHRQDI